MRRSYHLWKSYPAKEQWKGGTTTYVVNSFDTYEQARDFAKGMFANLGPDEGLEIASQGALVWGPFVKGGKYAP